MLTWDEVFVQFENLVKYAAGNVYREKAGVGVDSAVGADDLFQIGMIKLFECWQKYQHLPMEEFKAIFSTSLFRAVRRGAKNAPNFSLEEALVGEGSEDTYIKEIHFKDGLEHLMNGLDSPIAVAILQELIDPSPATIWQVWADNARKTHLVENQKEKLNISKTNKIKLKHIRMALQLSHKQFNFGISEIRSKAPYAFVM